MKKIVLLLLLLSLLNLYSQTDYTLSGYVKDKSSGETLIGATISVKDTKLGAVTNAYGFYSLSLTEGKYTVSVSYIGFEKLEKTFTLDKDTKLNIELDELDIESEEVLVTAEKANNNVASIEMSTVQLSAQTLNRMPALLGETDVIRSIQLLPGVASVGEGSTGFNVRGGGIDQNLVLLDEAPVYNASHLLGFFSVFNSDAIKDLKLYKGGMPAEFGCVFIAHLAERLAQGKLKVQLGVLVIDDQGPENAPLACAHCWNVYDDEQLDLSPWGECSYRTQYFTADDDDYWFYLEQTAPFGEVPKELLDADIDDLLAAMNGEETVINGSGTKIVTLICDKELTK